MRVLWNSSLCQMITHTHTLKHLRRSGFAESPTIHTFTHTHTPTIHLLIMNNCQAICLVWWRRRRCPAAAAHFSRSPSEPLMRSTRNARATTDKPATLYLGKCVLSAGISRLNCFTTYTRNNNYNARSIERTFFTYLRFFVCCCSSVWYCCFFACSGCCCFMFGAHAQKA